MIRRWTRFLAAGTFEGWRGERPTSHLEGMLATDPRFEQLSRVEQARIMAKRPPRPELADLAIWWDLKQELAAPAHFYGDGGTIHHTGHLDVETYEGRVVAVWFRCAMLPFEQVPVDDNRATEMLTSRPRSRLTGVEILDQPAA